MADNSVVQLLASGFFGAAVAAGLNHLVRKYEARQEKRKQESRAAYVMMTRVAPFVVMKDFLNKSNSIFDALFLPIQKELKGHSAREFDRAEVFATVICEMFKMENPLIDLKDFSVLMEMVAGGGKDWKQFDINIDQQTKFPKYTILYLSLVTQSEQSFLESLRQLTKASAHPENLLPQHFLGVWNSIKTLVRYSETLFYALKRFGEIDDKDTVTILVHQRTRMAPLDSILNVDKHKASEELAGLVSSRLKEFVANIHKRDTPT